MESRRVKITLEQARKWYKGDNAELKALAEQAFMKEELGTATYSEIKTFPDACKALGIKEEDLTANIVAMSKLAGNKFLLPAIAAYKISIIHKALHIGHSIDLTKGEVFYPPLEFIPVTKAQEKGMPTDKTFICNDVEYALVQTPFITSSSNGLSSYDKSGILQNRIGCATSEIAYHMAKYFSQEIFNACYGQYSEIYINGYNMKINFTKEHSEKLKSLLLDMLLNNDTIDGVLGQPLNVVELLHTTSIKGLNNIRISLGKKIEALESQDEWVASIVSQTQLDNLKTSKELVNLIIGYKRHLMEVAEIENKKNILKAQISRMKEEAKTPEDRLKEAEAELASLENPNF